MTPRPSLLHPAIPHLAAGFVPPLPFPCSRHSQPTKAPSDGWMAGWKLRRLDLCLLLGFPGSKHLQIIQTAAFLKPGSPHSYRLSRIEVNKPIRASVVSRIPDLMRPLLSRLQLRTVILVSTEPLKGNQIALSRPLLSPFSGFSVNDALVSFEEAVQRDWSNITQRDQSEPRAGQRADSLYSLLDIGLQFFKVGSGLRV